MISARGTVDVTSYRAIDLQNLDLTGQYDLLITELPLATPTDTTGVGVLSWKWDLREGRSRNLVKACSFAKSKKVQYLLVDVVSLNQNAPNMTDLVIEFSRLYSMSEIRVIFYYEDMRHLRRLWISHELQQFFRAKTIDSVASISISCSEHAVVRDVENLMVLSLLVDIPNCSLEKLLKHLPKADSYANLEDFIGHMNAQDIEGTLGDKAVNDGELDLEFPAVVPDDRDRSMLAFIRSWEEDRGLPVSAPFDIMAVFHDSLKDHFVSGDELKVLHKMGMNAADYDSNIQVFLLCAARLACQEFRWPFLIYLVGKISTSSVERCTAIRIRGITLNCTITVQKGSSMPLVISTVSVKVNGLHECRQELFADWYDGSSWQRVENFEDRSKLASEMVKDAFTEEEFGGEYRPFGLNWDRSQAYLREAV